MNLDYFIDMFVSDEEADDASLLFSSDSEDDNAEEHMKVTNFVETIESYSDSDFKMHFRLNRSTVWDLIDKYKSSRETHIGSGKQKLDAKNDMFIFLWYVANTETFRQLGNLFGVAKSTAWNVVVRVADFFVYKCREVIKWPSHEQATVISEKFERIKKIPNIIGVIDGTHIKIKAPRDHPSFYYNRKKFYSICLQVIVDANKKFIDVYCGEYGSYHDGRVLRLSSIFREINERHQFYFNQNQFILGDSAYPVKEWLVPPFKNNGVLTEQQRSFNTIHSSTRIIVENAIGLLKTRFRRLLHFTEHVDLQLLCKIVYSCCVLHNICLAQNDVLDGDPLPDDEEAVGENDQPFIPENDNRRQRLFEELISKNIILS